MLVLGLCVAMVIVSSVLYESALAWVQFRAVPRADGHLVPWQWVVAMAIRGLTLTVGTALGVTALPWQGAVLLGGVLLVIGLAAWPVAFHVDECRKHMANHAELARTLVRSGLSEAASAWLKAEPDAQVEKIVRRNEAIAMEMRSRAVDGQQTVAHS